MRTHIDVGAAAIESALCDAIGAPRFQLWFSGKTKFAWQDDQLVVGVPNLMYQDYLQKMYSAALEKMASNLRGERVALKWVIDPELFQKARQKQQEEAPRSSPPPARQTHPARQAALPLPQASRRRWRRFDDFVVGACNQLAHAAAQDVVEHLGQSSNPLVLHGPVGTGKSHLLEGIYSALRERQPQVRVHLLSAEEFTNRFLAAMHQAKLAAFRKLFRDGDALLIDDLHFLARKAATQEEFLHTFNALLAEGAQIVVTCDCHPRLNDQLLHELVDRLGGGAVFELQMPDAETRRRLLAAKGALPGRAPLTAEIVDLFATRLRGNVRELEGALHCLFHVSRATGRDIDLRLAEETLAEVLRHGVRTTNVEDVDRTVCQVLGLPSGALQSRERDWKTSHPRMLAMYLARKRTGATYGEIGQRFGGRNHSTAVAGEKKVRQWLADDSEIQLGGGRARVRDLVAKIENALDR